MAFKVSRAHFREKVNAAEKIAEEVEEVNATGSGNSRIPLTNQGFMHLAQYYPPVLKAADLDTLPDKLAKGEELGFSPIFDPKLVDACCVRGVFPLTLSVGQGFFVFAPKLHTMRSLCALVDTAEQLRAIKRFPYSDDLEGVFQQKRIQLSKKLIRPSVPEARQPSFDVFVNRKEDWSEAVAMIKEQHGENWLCSFLRRCFYWMFSNANEVSTKVILTVIRRHKYEGEGQKESGKDVVKEGDIVATELGYIVGDIYTSATGAYCLDGAGSLQLAVTGEVVKRLGCTIWDLGMKMDYKTNLLGCVEIRRKQWLQMVKEHKDSIAFTSAQSQALLGELQSGCPVSMFIPFTAENAVANPESKAQIKKRQKIENARTRRGVKTQQ